MNSSVKDHNGIRPWDFWSVHRTPVCSPVRDEYPDSEFELRDIDVFQNSSVENHNETELWDFWSGNIGIETPVYSPLSGTEVSSEYEYKLLGNGYLSPPLYPMNRPMQSPPPYSPMNRPMQSPPPCSPMYRPMQSPPPHSLMKMQSPPPHSPMYRPMQSPPPPSSPQSTIRRPSPCLPQILMGTPSESPQITSNSKSASCSWFRCSEINFENSISSSSYKQNYAPDSPEFFLKLQKARRASLNRAKPVPLKETREDRMRFQSLFARLVNAFPRKSLDAAKS